MVRSVLGGAALLSLVGASSWRRHAAVASVRAPVALSLSIDAPHYRQFMGDGACRLQCLTLERTLTDSVRRLLQARYAFIDWSGAGAADTVELHWIGRAPPDLLRSRVDFRIRSRRPRAELASYPVDFEGYKDLSPRITAPALWHPDSLRRVWLVRLATMLEQPDLLVEVFSRIPINAPVSFGPAGRATVKVRGRDIGATDETRPSFRVRARVTDPVNNTRDDADLILAKCQLATGADGYGCAVQQLAYVAETVEGDALIHRLRRSTLVVESVSVVELVSPERPSRFSGALLPREGVP